MNKFTEKLYLLALIFIIVPLIVLLSLKFSTPLGMGLLVVMPPLFISFILGAIFLFVAIGNSILKGSTMSPDFSKKYDKYLNITSIITGLLFFILAPMGKDLYEAITGYNFADIWIYAFAGILVLFGVIRFILK